MARGVGSGAGRGKGEVGTGALQPGCVSCCARHGESEGRHPPNREMLGGRDNNRLLFFLQDLMCISEQASS
eukprot:scaffold135126_cov13-Tisochrysis_lutea.AAC.1